MNFESLIVHTSVGIKWLYEERFTSFSYGTSTLIDNSKQMLIMWILVANIKRGEVLTETKTTVVL